MSKLENAPRDALVAILEQIHGEVARFLAEQIGVACYGQVMARVRVLDALKQLGVKFPPHCEDPGCREIAG